MLNLKHALSRKAGNRSHFFAMLCIMTDMTVPGIFTWSRHNRHVIGRLTLGHLLLCVLILLFWAVGRQLDANLQWLSAAFIGLQLYLATQLLLPALQLRVEERSRLFYLFWGTLLCLLIWLTGQLPATGDPPLFSAFKSSFLLFVATLIGATLARFVKHMWEILPICLMMALADFSSWLFGPTNDFSRQIEAYYRAPQGPPPPIDMVLVKMALPGATGLPPVFGISDWIMVAFFAIVAQRFEARDRTPQRGDDVRPPRTRIGRYLPLPALALLLAILLAHATGLFIPALPVIALVMLSWFLGRYLLQRSRGVD